MTTTTLNLDSVLDSIPEIRDSGGIANIGAFAGAELVADLQENEIGLEEALDSADAALSANHAAMNALLAQMAEFPVGEVPAELFDARANIESSISALTSARSSGNVSVIQSAVTAGGNTFNTAISSAVKAVDKTGITFAASLAEQAAIAAQNLAKNAMDFTGKIIDKFNPFGFDDLNEEAQAHFTPLINRGLDSLDRQSLGLQDLIGGDKAMKAAIEQNNTALSQLENLSQIQNLPESTPEEREIKDNILRKIDKVQANAERDGVQPMWAKKLLEEFEQGNMTPEELEQALHKNLKQDASVLAKNTLNALDAMDPADRQPIKDAVLEKFPGGTVEDILKVQQDLEDQGLMDSEHINKQMKIKKDLEAKQENGGTLNEKELDQLANANKLIAFKELGMVQELKNTAYNIRSHIAHSPEAQQELKNAIRDGRGDEYLQDMVDQNIISQEAAEQLKMTGKSSDEFLMDTLVSKDSETPYNKGTVAAWDKPQTKNDVYEITDEHIMAYTGFATAEESAAISGLLEQGTERAVENNAIMENNPFAALVDGLKLDGVTHDVDFKLMEGVQLTPMQGQAPIDPTLQDSLVATR